MNPITAIATATDALDLAHRGATPDALEALHRALLTVASAWEITTPDDPATAATQRALDAARAVRRANNPTATALALVAAEDAVALAREAHSSNVWYNQAAGTKVLRERGN